MPEIYRPEAESLIWDRLLDRLATGADLGLTLFEIKETYGQEMRDKIDHRISAVLLAHQGDRWPLRPEAQETDEIKPYRLIPVKDEWPKG